MIKPFVRHTGTAVPLRLRDVDTDQIIPAEHMKRLTRTGYSDGLFQRWRESDPLFALNRVEFADASILLAGADFGIGSSREHAVWALQDYGFAAVVSPRFGEIFANNAAKNGLLAISLDEVEVERMQQAVEERPSTEITIDLEECWIGYRNEGITFTIDHQTRYRLLNGLDDITLTMRRKNLIEKYERERRSWLPRTR
jgi:3-isopropylmalate/(R)-2-methylmalate dehydratase small subunit